MDQEATIIPTPILPLSTPLTYQLSNKSTTTSVTFLLDDTSIMSASIQRPSRKRPLETSPPTATAAISSSSSTPANSSQTAPSASSTGSTNDATAPMEIDPINEVVEEEQGDEEESESEEDEEEDEEQDADDEPSVECPICSEEFEVASDFLRLLPCAHTLCRECGIKLIGKNEQKNTIECLDCLKQHLLAHPNDVKDAATLMDGCPTLRQTQSRNVHLFSPTSTQHLQRCSQCAKAAVYFCKDDDCGYLCEDHEVRLHERYPDHPRETLIEREKKRSLKRMEKAKGAISKLDQIVLKWRKGEKLKLQRLNDEKVHLATVDSYLESLYQFQTQLPVWVQSFEQMKAYLRRSSNKVDEACDELLQCIKVKKDEIQQSDLMALETSLNLSEEEVQDLIDMTAIDAEEQKFVVEWNTRQPQLPLIHPAVQFARSLKGPSLLLALDGYGNSLTSFLKESKQSLTKASLLYRANWHGWMKEDFIRCCERKAHTLVLVKVAVTDGLFGTYIAPAWCQDGPISDPSRQSFLFSLTNRYGRPFRLSLKDSLRCFDLSTWDDIGFGGYSSKHNQLTNFDLFSGGRPGNHPKGNEAYGNKATVSAYELDDWKKWKETPPPQFELNHLTLAGKKKFAAAEIEVYQL